MRNDHENEVVLAIICKWTNGDKDLKVRTSSVIVDYKYHGPLDAAILSAYDNINPINIIKSKFDDRLDIKNINIIDKFVYVCNPIKSATYGDRSESYEYNNVRYDASFVMPYDVGEEGE